MLRAAALKWYTDILQEDILQQDILPKDILQEAFLPKDILPKDILPNGRFAERTFRRWTNCRKKFYRTDIFQQRLTSGNNKFIIYNSYQSRWEL